MHGIVLFRAQVRGVMVAQFLGLFRGKILLFRGVEVFLHLADDVLGLVVVMDIEIGRGLCHLISVPAGRTEFPALEIVHVGECPAARTPDYEVHNYEVIHAIIIKIYRQKNRSDCID